MGGMLNTRETDARSDAISIRPLVLMTRAVTLATIRAVMVAADPGVRPTHVPAGGTETAAPRAATIQNAAVETATALAEQTVMARTALTASEPAVEDEYAELRPVK